MGPGLYGGVETVSRALRPALWLGLSVPEHHEVPGYLASLHSAVNQSGGRVKLCTAGVRHCDRRPCIERIYYGLDQYIADTNSYNRSFPCMEATYPYTIKTQQKTRNAPSRGLWALGALS